MPSAEEMVEIRQLVTSGLGEIGPEEVEQTDVEKISSDDVYLAKFFRHVFEAPGEQTEAAAKMILNTLKWRKAQEANSIKEADFPPGIFEKGALFSRNRSHKRYLSCKIVKVFCFAETKTAGNCWFSAFSNISRDKKRWRT